MKYDPEKSKVKSAELISIFCPVFLSGIDRLIEDHYKNQPDKHDDN